MLASRLGLAFLLWIIEFVVFWLWLSRRGRFEISPQKASLTAILLLFGAFLPLVGGYFILLGIHAMQKDSITWPGLIVLVVIGWLFIDAQICALRILLDSLVFVTQPKADASEDSAESDEDSAKAVEP